MTKLESDPLISDRQITEPELSKKLDRWRRQDLQVESIMTANPVSITQQKTVHEAAQMMLTHNVKRLPVVNSQEILVGIICRVDILRAMSFSLVGETRRKIISKGHSTYIKDIMMTNVPAVRADDSLSDVVALLGSNIQHRVVVVDETKRVVGFITDGDLFERAITTERMGVIQTLGRRLALHPGHLRLDQRTAHEVMTTPVITVHVDAQLDEALQLLLKHHIKRLPVADNEGHFLGLVGRGGILHVLGRIEY